MQQTSFNGWICERLICLSQSEEPGLVRHLFSYVSQKAFLPDFGLPKLLFYVPMLSADNFYMVTSKVFSPLNPFKEHKIIFQADIVRFPPLIGILSFILFCLEDMNRSDESGQESWACLLIIHLKSILIN